MTDNALTTEARERLEAEIRDQLYDAENLASDFSDDDPNAEIYRAVVARHRALSADIEAALLALAQAQQEAERFRAALKQIGDGDWYWKGGGSEVKLTGKWGRVARAALSPDAGDQP